MDVNKDIDSMIEKIKKHDHNLTTSETMMLTILSRLCLVLDICLEVDNAGTTHLIAYNIEREQLLNKII